MHRRLAVATGALLVVDVGFFIVLAIACDAVARIDALVIGVYVACAALLVVRVRHYFLFFDTLSAYRESPDVPLPTSDLHSPIAAALYSIIVLALMHAWPCASTDSRRIALYVAYALACGSHVLFALVFDDRRVLRAYVRRHVIERFRRDPPASRAIWHGSSVASTDALDALGSGSASDDGDWTSVVLDDMRTEVSEALFDDDDDETSDARRRRILAARRKRRTAVQ